MNFFLENLRTSPNSFWLSNLVIKIFGPDSESYLNSQTTNNVLELKPDSFQFNCLLDLSGRIIGTFLLCKRSESEFYLVFKEEYKEQVIERIEKFHISEDFELEILNQTVSLLTKSDVCESFKGQYFFEDDQVVFSKRKENFDHYKLLKILSGVPELGIEVKPLELINNTFFDDLAVSYSKGCYPGQETVAKIETRRGAAFKPVLIVLPGTFELAEEKITQKGKKIAEVRNSITFDGNTYLYVSLNRENRIDKLNLSFEILDDKYEGIIHYFPYLSPYKKDLAIDLYDYAMELFHRNDYNQAKEYFQKSINIDPLFEDAYESLGVLHGRLNEYDEAIKTMEKLKEINPKCMMAYTNLSLFHMKIGHIETAETYKSEATLLNFQLLGDQAESKKKQLELEKRKQEDILKREKMFLQVLEIDPDDAMANNGMGEIMFERDNFEQAREYFDKAITSDKKYSVAYLGLAKCLYKLSLFDKLNIILEQGIMTASKNGDLVPANEMQSLKVKLDAKEY